MNETDAALQEPSRPLCVILGLGYSGAALKTRLEKAGWAVVGTSRSVRPGVVRFDGAVEPPLEAALAHADAVLCSIPPDAQGCPALRALAPMLTDRPRWLGYFSTTGVYGDLGGRWAFEWTPPAPNSEVAARRALAERQWLALGAQVFRLPGIYGPGRSAFDALRAGQARRVIKPGQVFSRVHVDDIAAGVAASLAHPSPGAIYNLCDDEPCPPQDVTAFAAGLLGLPVPPDEPFESATLSPAARRFWDDNKRVSNARAKAALGWRPAYPSYREGLAAIVKQETS